MSSSVETKVHSDLAKRKTYPAIYRLYTEGLLPKNTTIVGYARSSLTVNDFHARILPHLKVMLYLLCVGCEECVLWCAWRVCVGRWNAPRKTIVDTLNTWGG